MDLKFSIVLKFTKIRTPAESEFQFCTPFLTIGVKICWTDRDKPCSRGFLTQKEFIIISNNFFVIQLSQYQNSPQNSGRVDPTVVPTQPHFWGSMACCTSLTSHIPLITCWLFFYVLHLWCKKIFALYVTRLIFGSPFLPEVTSISFTGECSYWSKLAFCRFRTRFCKASQNLTMGSWDLISFLIN